MSIIPWFWLLGNQGNQRTDEDTGLSEIDKYKRKIRKNSNEKINELIGNFSFEGFNEIFICLLQNTKYELNIFIDDFDSIFTDESFRYFKYILNEYKTNGVKVFLSTFNSKRDDRFVSLENEFEIFKYLSVSCKNPEELHNFIVSDCKSAWVEDNISVHYKITVGNKDKISSRFIKACVNFNDPIYAAKWLDTMDRVKEIYKNKN